jgi:outer membrane lipoprotein SlyB
MKHHASFSFIVVTLGLSAALLSGCATPVAKPAFYPNAHYQHMGPAQAQADAQACSDMARQSEVGAVNKIDTARAGAAGAAGVATAGVIGSVLSGQKPDLRSITAGAAAIGAGGAAATAAGQSVGGSGLYRQFVQQCLAERGYQVIGWH